MAQSNKSTRLCSAGKLQVLASTAQELLKFKHSHRGVLGIIGRRQFNKAGCGRSPGSDDELAGLGLDTGPRRLKTTDMQAKEKPEA